MKGRKPKPTAVKRASGNPGRRPLNEQEPTFGANLRMPAEIAADRAARLEWRRVVAEMLRAGVVTEVDRAMLANYCKAWSRWLTAEQVVREKGMVVKTAAGNLIQNPYLAIANRAMEQLRAVAVEFGMTPSSRSRIKVEAAEELSLAEILFDPVGAGNRDEADQ